MQSGAALDTDCLVGSHVGKGINCNFLLTTFGYQVAYQTASIAPPKPYKKTAAQLDAKAAIRAVDDTQRCDDTTGYQTPSIASRNSLNNSSGSLNSDRMRFTNLALRAISSIGVREG